MTRTIDFDAFRQEQEAEPLVLKLGGKEYQLPSAIPAQLALEIIRIRAQYGPEHDIEPQELDKLGRALFGPDLWATCLGEGHVTIDELPALIQFVLNEYGGEEGILPNREARRARRAKRATGSR